MLRILQYHKVLDANPAVLNPIREAAKKGRVTLLFEKWDTEHNNAVALLRHLTN